jgi:hypothetical protein
LFEKPARQHPDAGLASSVFLDHLSENVLVERQIGHETLQTRVVLPQLAHFAHTADTQAAELLALVVEARLAHAQLSTNIGATNPEVPHPAHRALPPRQDCRRAIACQ